MDLSNRLILAALVSVSLSADSTPVVFSHPKNAETLIEGAFQRSEGIAFNGEGRLFVTADRALWKVEVGVTGAPIHR